MDPSLGEQSASSKDEDNVEDGVEGVGNNFHHTVGRRQVVNETTDGDHVRTTSFSKTPLTQETNDEVTVEVSVEHLREEVKVGNKSGLEDDGHVGGVEKLDGVRLDGTSDSVVLEGDIDLETLEVDNDDEDKGGRDQTSQVGEVRSVEGVLEGNELVVNDEQTVEEIQNSTFVLFSFKTGNGVGDGGERFPDDGFADVDGDENGDSGVTQTVTLGE